MTSTRQAPKDMNKSDDKTVTKHTDHKQKKGTKEKKKDNKFIRFFKRLYVSDKTDNKERFEKKTRSKEGREQLHAENREKQKKKTRPGKKETPSGTSSSQQKPLHRRKQTTKKPKESSSSPSSSSEAEQVLKERQKEVVKEEAKASPRKPTIDGDVEASSSSSSSTVVPAEAKARKPAPVRNKHGKTELSPIRKSDSTPAAPTVEPTGPVLKAKSTPTARVRRDRKRRERADRDMDKDMTAAITEVRRDEQEEDKEEREERKEMPIEEVEQLMEQADALAEEMKQEEADKITGGNAEEAESSEERVQDDLVVEPTEIPKKPDTEDFLYEELAKKKRRILQVDDVKTSESANKDSPHE